MIKFCPNCGTKVIANSKFCLECGLSFQKIIEQNSEESQFDDEKHLPSVQENGNTKTVHEFALLNKTIQVSQDLARYACVRKVFAEHAYSKMQEFASEYEDNVKNFDDMFSEGIFLAVEKIKESLQLGVEVLIRLNIMDYDYKRMCEICVDYVNYERYLEPLRAQTEKISDAADELASYRQAQRNSRSSWEGGGFGFGGAIKGALMAGVLNVGTNAIRGIGDSLTDSSDRKKIAEMKKMVFNDRALFIRLVKGVEDCCFGVFYGICEILDLTIDIDNERASARFNNSIRQFQQDDITLNEFQERIIDLINSNPFCVDFYATLHILNPAIDEKIGEVASYFGLYSEYFDRIEDYDFGRLIAQDEARSIDNIEEREIRWYEKAANQGQVDAQYTLASAYSEINEKEAARWYRKAAEQGHADAQYELGYAYQFGNGVEENDEQAMIWTKKAAEQGHRTAQYSLGLAYSSGIGIEKDDVEALKWYEKAAKQGHSIAQHALAERYLTGIGTEENMEMAIKWYKTAAENENPDSQYAYAKLADLPLCEAVRLIQEAAEQDVSDAQYDMGEFYEQGILDDGEKNIEKALEWYEKAAEEKNSEAQYKLGLFYLEGIVVKKSERRAVQYFMEAAEDGHIQAQNELGVCFANGTGVGRNYEKAVMLYRQAAESGEAEAQFNLGMCYYYGAGIDKSEQEAMKWYKQAALQGHPDAIKILKGEN